MNTILVIDDNYDYRSGLIEILGFENYATLEAEDGLAGLQMIRQHFPNLIICDIDMPGMTGIEVLRAVKCDPIYATIPFIVATGHIDALTMKTARDLGAEKFLAKPFDIPKFLAVIVDFLTEKNRDSDELSRRVTQ